MFQVLRDILLHEGRVVPDQPDDEEELPVLPLQEVPRVGHEDRLGPARRRAPQESVKLYCYRCELSDMLQIKSEIK